MRSIISEYLDKGWTAPLPLPAGRKELPPAGYTGRIPETPEEEIRALWASKGPDSNVGLRMPSCVIGIDVDDSEKFARFIEEHDLSALQGTYYSTRHGGDSKRRHWFFRVPDGTEWQGQFPGGDVLQMIHRYAVAYPSVVDGKAYKWYRDGNETGIPAVDELPTLPADWIEALKKSSGTVSMSGPIDPVSLETATAWLEGNTIAFQSEEAGPYFAHVLEALNFDDGAYNTMRDTVHKFVRQAVKDGAPGLAPALDELGELYEREVTSRRGEGYLPAHEAEKKFILALCGAVSKIKAEVEAGTVRPFTEITEGVDWDRFAQALADGSWLMREELEEPVPDYGDSLEEKRAAAVAAVEAGTDYWDRYPVLAEIAQYAERAAVDKYSLLFRVLTYLSAQMPPTVYLEDYRQPLTLYSAVIAESGSGKGVLDAVADALVGEHKYSGETVIRPGTGNMHTLLTAFGDFSRPPVDKETGAELPMKKHRMLIQGNELAAWAEMQGNAEWSGTMADVFDGRGDYEVRDTSNCYHFDVDQHSLAVTFSVQPDAARYLFAATGRGLPGRFLISALPPRERTLPEDFDPWDLSSSVEVDTFDPARDVEPLKINKRFFMQFTPFQLSDDAKRVNAQLKRAWDEDLGDNRRLRAEKIFSQMPKVRLRVAVLLTVLLDLGEGTEVPLEALKLADFLLQVSVENTRYARALAERAERSANAAVVATRRLAEEDGDLEIARQDVLSVIEKSKSGKAGLARMKDRKRRSADRHAEAVAQLLADGMIEEVANSNGPVSYRLA